MARVLREEGVRGFWRGNFAACLRVGINRGTMFLTNDVFVAALTPGNQPLSDARRLAAGSLSGVVLVVSAYPLELAQTRLATLAGQYTGISHCLREAYARHGVRGLFAGLVPSILGVAPYVAVQFWLYDKSVRQPRGDCRSLCCIYSPPTRMHHRCFCRLKRKLRGSRDKVAWWQQLMSGAAAGAVGQTVSYPFDTIRRQMQVADAVRIRDSASPAPRMRTYFRVCPSRI